MLHKWDWLRPLFYGISYHKLFLAFGFSRTLNVFFYIYVISTSIFSSRFSFYWKKKSILWFLSTNNEKCEPLATSVGQDKQMGHHLRVVISTWHAIRCLQVLPFSSPKTRKHSMVVLVQSGFTPWVYIACIRPQTWQVVNPMIHQPINASRCNNFHHKHKQLFWWDNARFDWPYYLPWIMILPDLEIYNELPKHCQGNLPRGKDAPDLSLRWK